MLMIKPYCEMGSHMSSVGQKSESAETQTPGDKVSLYKTAKAERQTEATNTNAREHTQPDRLKILFREHRGYKSLSEQKVTEWLSKNKQFYTVVPRDVTEIPEHIYSPLENPASSWANDLSGAPRSEISGHNAEPNIQLQRSYDGYLARGPHDKMNHYFHKPLGQKISGGNSSVTQNKSEILSQRIVKLSHKHNNRDYKRYALYEGEELRIEPTTVIGEINSNRLIPRDFDYLISANKRQKITCSRRESHSVIPKFSLVKAKKNEGWPNSHTHTSNRKTLPNMLQNNAFIKQSTKLPVTNTNCTKSLQPSSTHKIHRYELKNARLNADCCRRKFQKNISLLPVDQAIRKNSCSDQSHHKLLIYPSFWSCSHALKSLNKFTSVWMTPTDKINNEAKRVVNTNYRISPIDEFNSART